MTQKEVNEIIKTLNSGKFHIECPACEEKISLLTLRSLDLNTPATLLVIIFTR